MYINQISVFIENRPGRLSAIAKVLAENNIDIRALSLADTTNFGILRLIVDRPAEAEKVLRENDFTVSVTKVIAVRVEDKPGGMYKLLDKLYDASVAVEYAYAFIARKADSAFVIIRAEDNDKAAECLKAAGFRLLEEEEIYTI
jgi:hypothetical protein